MRDDPEYDDKENRPKRRESRKDRDESPRRRREDSRGRRHRRDDRYDDRRRYDDYPRRRYDDPPPRFHHRRHRDDSEDEDDDDDHYYHHHRRRPPPPPPYYRGGGPPPPPLPPVPVPRDYRPRSRSRDRAPKGPSHVKVPLPDYKIVEQKKDEMLGENVQADPRGEDPNERLSKKASNRGNGRNTESFDPASTLVRPDLRIHVGSPSVDVFQKKLKHDDVVIIPELFGKEDDWGLYYKLVKEMTELQSKGTEGTEWIAWHEGAHLIIKKPEESGTFQTIIDRLCQYFNIRKDSIGTRFNWYKDSSDWKPFHHDSAAFNPKRAKNQNITVGASFGAMRELAFIRASPLEDGEKVKVYFPQTNNGVFSFGRDANILWKHGVNAVHPDEQIGKGRISIILWGLAQDVVEEAGSPPLLGADGQGPHANKRRRDRRRR